MIWDMSTSVTAIFCLFPFPFAVFICSFMVAAPIFGYLGDRFNRKVILSCGIFFWSIVTLSSSFISKEVQHRIHSLTETVEQSLQCYSIRPLPSLWYSLHRQANYSGMVWICLMLRLVKWNDSLVKLDTHFAFVDILYVSLPAPRSFSLAASQSTNEGPCLRLVSITILSKIRLCCFTSPWQGDQDLISPKAPVCPLFFGWWCGENTEN